MKPIRLLSLLITILLAALLVACAPDGSEPPAVPETVEDPGASSEEPATVAATPVATSTAEEATHGGPIENYVSLVDALRFTGATVQPVEGVDQPFFEPQAQVVEVNGEAVQVFEFADEEAATAATETVADDGSSVGTTMLTWVDTPHFYRVDRVIVLYVGSDQETLSLLQQVLGEPFAAG